MSRLYVGRLASRTRERDLEDAFGKYGKIRSIDLKYGFAFVEFSDPRDADDAVRGLDGRDLDGARIQVEMARGGRGRDSRDGERGYGAAGVSRSEFRLIVEGLSRDVSWQDLKDHFRTAGDILFTDVFPDREGRSKGVVEYRNRDDLKAAVAKCDGTEIRGSRITVREDDGKESIPPPQVFRRRRSPPRGRGRSPSPRRGRSRSRTPPRRRSPSPRRRSPSPRRRSPSPRRDKSPR